MLIFVSVSVFALFNPKITIIQGLWRKINDAVTVVLKDVEVCRWSFSLSWMPLSCLSVVKPTSCRMFIRPDEFTADSAASCSRYLCWAKLLNILSFIKVRFISLLHIRFECWQSYQDGTLHKSVGSISHIHAVKSWEKTFGKWEEADWTSLLSVSKWTYQTFYCQLKQLATAWGFFFYLCKGRHYTLVAEPQCAAVFNWTLAGVGPHQGEKRLVGRAF